MFRQRIKGSDAILFVPQIRSLRTCPLEECDIMPSRPYGQSAWNGKPGAVLSASPSAIGGRRKTITCGSR